MRMKVKELAEIFKVPTQELLNMLSNVGVNLDQQEETMIDAQWEKKLAKRYNVPYPFKTSAKPKPVNKVVIPSAKPKTTPQPKTASSSGPKPKEAPTRDVKNNNNKAVPTNNGKNETRGTAEKEPVKKQEVKTEIPSPEVQKPKTIILNKNEVVAPRVDEEILSKYGDYLDDDEYNITRENRPKKNNNKKNDVEKQNAPKVYKNGRKQIQNTKGTSTRNKKRDEPKEKVVYYEQGMTVLEVAEAMDTSVTDLVKKLFVSMGMMVGANSPLDRDTTELLALDYQYEVKDKQITDMTRFDEMEIVDDEKDLVPRPPVVTVMGHVDHGKTTLIDNIRATHVVAGEAGGITQHIGAYQVEKNGRLITFIDTPGHAAFTEMRARGAQITDIVVLIVAADDGVMPQTKEAIQHAKAAGVPIIVAINKMDKPGANPERIKQELTEFGLLAEEWGGDTIFVPISALHGDGVPELLEMILLVADLKDYKANPNRLGVGTVIEARLDKSRGPIATLLVKNGSIKVGDVLVVGNTYGKIRSMNDEMGRSVSVATPSKPVEVTGIEEVPFAGEKFMIYNNERKAREVAEARAFKQFEKDKGIGTTISLSEMLKSKGDDSLKQLNLILKCDVQGSIEAIKGLLEKINIEGTQINVIASGVGGVVETDVNLAIASKAIIICFNVRPIAYITEMAKDHGIEIRLYNIIYKLQEDIEKAVKGLLDPVFEEKITGQAEVRETFKVSKVGTIAGCYVTSGFVQRNSGVRLIRDSIVVYEGKLSSLRRFKDDVKEVKQGYDCGMTIENYNDVKIGDVLEFFVMEEVER